MQAVADATEARETIRNPLFDNRNHGLGLATLVGEDHGNSQVQCNLAGNCPRKWPNVPEQPVFLPGVAIGEVGPGRRDDGDIDPVAIVTPDLAIDHIRADSQADSTPARLDHGALPSRLEPEALPEDQVSFSIDLGLTVGSDVGEGVVQVSSFAFDETGRDVHLPLTATFTQVLERWAFWPFADGRVVGEESVTRVEHFREDREFGPAQVGTVQ